MTRPRRTASLVASLLVVLGVAALGSGVAHAQDFDAAGEQAMLERINALRAEQQLAPLERMPTLDAVARAHSAEMASNGALSHVSAQTGSPEDRVRNAGVTASGLSENVALHRDAALAHQALLASAPHRGNMLSPDATHVGLGAVRTEAGTYVTQIFAQLPPPAPLAEVVTAEDPAIDPAAAPVEVAPEPMFGIIPPFLEHVAEQVAGAPESAEAPADAPAEPAIVAAPSAAVPSVEPSVESGAPIADEPAPAPSAAATQNALRQLVDIAQAFLRGPSAATPAAR